MHKLLSRLPALGAAFVAVVGALTSADVVAVLPDKWGPVLVVVGAVWGALTRPVAGQHAPGA